MKKTVLLIVTLDTKGPEAFFLKAELERRGVTALLMNTGIFPCSMGEGDISRQEVAQAGGRSLDELLAANDKGAAIGAMMDGAVKLTRNFYDAGKIHGVLSIGGAQGTIMGTSAMRSLPFGVPKVMLSTMASGKRPFERYVGTADITLMHSVVDFFGLNPLLMQVLRNAAAAVAGMVQADRVAGGKGTRIAITIYGTTTTAGARIVGLMQKKGYEMVAFHPNGAGGQAMEEMIRAGMFDGVMDLTTHELMDELAGGEHAAGPARLEAASLMGIPQVVVPGSTDYIVAGRFAELKRSFRQRKTMMHNPAMTFVQPSDREMARLGRMMAEKLNRSRGNTVVMVPMAGFCDPSRAGRVFHNPAGVEAFVKSLQTHISPSIPVQLLPWHVNDEPFSAAMVEEFEELMRAKTAAAHGGSQ
jgi:uncharacterized protein (UPF0261 family)